VVDEDNRPIPYVNIWVEGENIGTTSKEDGTFIINCSNEKILVFSAIGFKTQKTSLHNKERVLLTSKIFQLDEVLITKFKNTKELEIGGAKKIHHTHLSGDKPWIYARLFPFKEVYKETPFLKKIIFFSNSEKSNAKLRIRIMEFNDSIPADDLLYEDIIVTVKKGMKKNVVDVSEHKIGFSKKGIVIGLEWLIIEENKFEFEYKDQNNKKKIRMINYAPSLVVNYSDEEHSFDYSSGKWRRRKKYKLNNHEKWDNKVITPAINLILTN
jgi:hypothetical protein